ESESEEETESEFEEEELENRLFGYSEDESQTFHYNRSRNKVSKRVVEDDSAVVQYNTQIPTFKAGNDWRNSCSDDEGRQSGGEDHSDDESEETRDFFFDEAETPQELDVGELEDDDHDKMEKLLIGYNELFAWTSQDLGRTDLVTHAIDTGDAAPIRQCYYRTSPKECEFLHEEITRMISEGIIRPSYSPWASPIVLVKQKDKTRFCIDYRKLNSVTKKDSYPLPRIDDLLDILRHSSWYTSLDLASGYWQIEMNPADREKTAFISQFGTFEFDVMPFGLTNAPATFQRLMDRIFREIVGKFVVVYLDDINIFSSSFDEHIHHLTEVFDHLRFAGLKLNPKKCHFAKKELKFLGYVVNRKGISTDSKKVEVVKNFPMPTNLRQLRGFLGLASYYRRFIRDFSKIASPL